MARLNQLLAASKTARKDANDTVTALYHTAQKGQLFNGLQRTYEPLEDGGVQLPPESQLVQQTVGDLTSALRQAMAKLWNTVGAIDMTNTVARADITLGDKVYPDVPATHLLFLEKQLNDLRTVIEKLPTLDPAAEWRANEHTGLQETVPVKTHRTQKVTTPVVVVPPTDKHPAQVHVKEADVAVGYWTTVKLSGALPATERRKLLDKVTELQKAVKAAREQANMVDVQKLDTGEILGWIFD